MPWYNRMQHVAALSSPLPNLFKFQLLAQNLTKARYKEADAPEAIDMSKKNATEGTLQQVFLMLTAQTRYDRSMYRAPAACMLDTPSWATFSTC
jgi:hypothetical protein